MGRGAFVAARGCWIAREGSWKLRSSKKVCVCGVGGIYDADAALVAKVSTPLL